jgi:hypothetical protein
MRPELTDITLVIDRSGSMQSTRHDAEGGVNAFVAEQAKRPGEALLTLVQPIRMRCPGLTATFFVGSSGLYREAVVPRSPGSAAFRGVTLGARRAPDASGESKATTHAGVRRARNNPRFASVHTGRRVFRSRNTRVWLMIYGSTVPVQWVTCGTEMNNITR